MKLSFLAYLFAFFLSLGNALCANGKKIVLEVDLAKLTTLAEFSEIAPTDLELLYARGESYNFKWLNKQKSRAIFSKSQYSNVKTNLTMLQGKVEIDEAVVDFENGFLSGITVSIFNRGDGGRINLAEFQSRYELAKNHLSASWIRGQARGMVILLKEL